MFLDKAVHHLCRFHGVGTAGGIDQNATYFQRLRRRREQPGLQFRKFLHGLRRNAVFRFRTAGDDPHVAARDVQEDAVK